MRAVDWSQVGIPGGIPTNRAQCGSTIAAGSSQATIQSSLNTCASSHPVTGNSPGDGGYVLLGPGTFTVSSLSIPENVTLRGSGADQTILNESGSGSLIAMDAGDPSLTAVSIVSGGTKGSQSIVVSSAANFTIGQFAYITEINSNGVSNTGSGGTCSWCDSIGDGGNRNKGQIVEVTAKNGSTLGITPALYSDYTNSPQATPYTMLKYAGVENLQVYANNSGHTQNIYMRGCAYCWVKGFEGNYVDGNGNHASVHFDYRCEVRDSYFSDAYVHSNGSTESEIQLAYKTSGCLIENNIMERTQTGINTGYGSAGNVVAYNYLHSQMDQGSPALLGTGTYTHGAHPQFNLFEGNVTQTLYSDAVWGTAGYFTAFRNWTKGTGLTCTPLSLRGTINCAAATKQNAAARSVQIDGLSTNANLVGNIVGSAEQNALSDTKTAWVVYPTNRNGWTGTVYGWSFGYAATSDDGTGYPGIDSANACNTAFVTGNYTFTGSSPTLTWANGLGCQNTGGTSQALPASFYHYSKPAWWGSLPWPAIGPDVTGGTGPGGHTSLTAANPAMNCFYNVMGGTEGGAGGPYKFNAGNCYSSSGGGTALLPPSGLAAVAH
jgi:hypothetical protein